MNTIDAESEDYIPSCLDCDNEAAPIDEYWYGSYCQRHKAEHDAEKPVRTCNVLVHTPKGIPSACGEQSVISIRPKGCDVPARYCMEHVNLAPEIDQTLVSPYDY